MEETLTIILEINKQTIFDEFPFVKFFMKQTFLLKLFFYINKYNEQNF